MAAFAIGEGAVPSAHVVSALQSLLTVPATDGQLMVFEWASGP
jgi:hypothetical protein